jgi:Leucine-rich repeat (LRR) protein
VRGKNMALVELAQQQRGSLVGFAGKSVVAVTAAGEVIADSTIDESGRFAVPAPAGRIVGLVIAERRANTWVCLAPLQYERAGNRQPVILDVPESGFMGSLNVGDFSFDNQGDLSQDAARLRDASVIVPLRNAAAGFQDGSFANCGQAPDTLTVQGDIDWRGATLGTDVAENLLFRNAVALLLEPTADSEDEFIAATNLNEQGRFSRTVRRDALTGDRLSVILSDASLFADKEVNFPLHPTFDLAALSGQPQGTLQFGTVPLGLAYRSGVVSDSAGNPVADAFVYIVLDSDDTLAYNFAVTDAQGRYRLLVPVSNVPYTFVAEAYDPVLDDFVFASKTSPDRAGYVVTRADVLRDEDFTLDLADVSTSTPVTIADPNLEDAIRTELGKAAGELTNVDMRRLRYLDASLAGIRDLRGLEAATNLEQLLLYDNAISDLSPLENLANLNELDLAGNQIADLSPLVRNAQRGGFGSGDVIYVEDNALDLQDGSADRADIAAILASGADCFYGIDEAEFLAGSVPVSVPQTITGTFSEDDTRLYGVPVDVYTLAATGSSQGIDIQLDSTVPSYVLVLTEEGDFVTEGDTGVRFATAPDQAYVIIANALDGSDLGAYTLALRPVANEPAQVADANLAAALAEEVGKPVDQLTKLDLESVVWLDASYADITSLSGLEAAVNLAYLDVSGNPFSDLSPLAGLDKLEELILSESQVSDLRPLAGLANLLVLDVAFSSDISDLRPLANLTNLEVLAAPFGSISDPSPVVGLPALRELDLEGNVIADVTPLAGLGALELVNLEFNEISDVRPLLQSDLGEGSELLLSDNPLTAASIAALDTLRARGVFVSFVDPLANIPAPNMLQRLPVAGEQVGSLEETDFIIYDNSFADAYVLAPQAGSGVLLLDLASDFAGELLVLSEGIIVAANNEASEDGSVLLDVEIEAGNAYVVVVTSVNFQTGSYTLVSFLE